MIDGYGRKVYVGGILWASIKGVAQGVLFFAIGTTFLRALFFLITGA